MAAHLFLQTIEAHSKGNRTRTRTEIPNYVCTILSLTEKDRNI
jgi:hypothetical protein